MKIHFCINGWVSDEWTSVPVKRQDGSVRSQNISTQMCNLNMIKLQYHFAIEESNKTLSMNDVKNHFFDWFVVLQTSNWCWLMNHESWITIYFLIILYESSEPPWTFVTKPQHIQQLGCPDASYHIFNFLQIRDSLHQKSINDDWVQTYFFTSK